MTRVNRSDNDDKQTFTNHLNRKSRVISLLIRRFQALSIALAHRYNLRSNRSPSASSVTGGIPIQLNQLNCEMADPTTKAFESIKSFSGGSHENSRDWCDRAEIIFNAFNVNDNDRLARIGMKFDNSAFDWYRDNQGPYTTWIQFRQVLERAFPPPARTLNRHLLAEQINQRKQGADESVHDYYYALDKLCREYDPQMSAVDKTIKLVGGLHPQLKEKMLSLNVQTPEEFMHHAKNFESSQKVMANHYYRRESMELMEPMYTFESNQYSTIAATRSDHRHNQPVNAVVNGRPKSANYLYQQPNQKHMNDSSIERERLAINYRHGQSSNYHQNTRNDRQSKYNGMKCFRCGRFGHIQRECSVHLNDYKDQ